MRRSSRYAVFPPKTTKQPFISDDVEISRIFDFSCMNNGNYLSFPQIIRQIGNVLQNPVTTLSTEIKNIDSWSKKRGCAPLNEINEITSKIDEITSQLLTLLPMSQPLAITQYIVGPLLELAADGLEGKKISIDGILQQITQQARFSIAGMSKTEMMHLSTSPKLKKNQVDLPGFYIKNGVNYINVNIKNNVLSTPIKEHNGKFFAVVPQVEKNGEHKYQVYFNHLARKWEVTGNGKFNRFSKQERQLVQRLSLENDYRRPSDKTTIYCAKNSFPLPPENLEAIEMYGRLVPYRTDPKTGKSFIYDASTKHSDTYEVVIAENEWHLKKIKNYQIKTESLYCPRYGINLDVAVVKKKNGQEILSQINLDAGFFWGNKYCRTKENHLGFFSSVSNKKYNCKRNIAMKGINFRNKRGARLSKGCLAYCDSFSSNNDITVDGVNTGHVLSEGSISTVYDIGNGYVIKKYKGYFDDNYRSRIQFAESNVKGFNRYYGNNSATLQVTQHENGKSSVATKLIKIEGFSLSEISVVSDKNILSDILSNIKKTPHETLSKLLREKGIVHHDINKANIIYNVNQGFSVIDFDSAYFYPDGVSANPSQEEYMKNKFTYVFKETQRDIESRLRELDRSKK
ncbi:hypothetical protein H5A43_13605 [Pectobacterium brasiliense]|nr:hypothetical protein [Pectobacterium brasiliense]